MRFGRYPLALWASTAAISIRPTFATAAAFVPASSSRARFASKRSMTTATTNSNNNSVRIALCQFKVTDDKQVNHQTCKSYLERAAEAGAQLVVLPEIWNSPYATAAFSEYAEVLPHVGVSETESPSARLLMDFAKQHQMWVVGGSVPEVEGGKLYNTCLVVSPQGEIVAKHRKIHLFDISVPGGITFRESDTLEGGSGLTCFDGGDVLGMVGVGICYDIRFPEYALLLSQKYKCKLLIYPGAFNLTTGPAHWELLQRARAVDNQCYVCMASPARSPEPEAETKYPHYTAWGHSTVVAPWGDILATTDEKEALVVADLDMNKVDEMRQAIPCFEQKRNDLYVLQDPNDETS